jgi:hypothetical protein
MTLPEALAAFLQHPTALGALALLVAAFVYGTIRFTAAATRGAIALEAVRFEMVGVRQDLTGVREEQRGEHEKTRGVVRDEHKATTAVVAAVRDDVIQIQSQLDRSEAVAAAAAGKHR